jgi:hypothetical protein
MQAKRDEYYAISLANSGTTKADTGIDVDGGLFTLFAIAFFLIGIALFGVGLLGEYIGRIYMEVRQRPRYQIATILDTTSEKNQAS